MSQLITKARQRLLIQGGRMTAQRLLILKTLDSLETHPTAEELYDIVIREDPSLHLSTVYRTLRWLEQEGLVSTRRFHEDRQQDRFDPVLPAEHHHFLCTSCKSVIEFDNPLIQDVKKQFEKNTNLQVDRVTLMFYGLCENCIRKNQEKSV